MKGARGLLGGVLILVVVCAVPAVSAAQDAASTDTTTTTTPSSEPANPEAPAPAPTPSSPSPAPTDSGHGGSSTHSGATSGDAAAGTPTGAAGDSGEPSTQLRDRSPADASPGGAHSSATTVVTMGDNFFSPATITVAVGDIVTWRNEGHEPHTATADDGSFDTGTVSAGSRASHMFDKPGTFSYVCTIHANMKGTVRVLGSGGGEGTGSGTASGSASGPTEAQAVNSPDAAGDANTLPASGMPEGPLALVGLALLGSGLIARRSARRFAPGRQLSLF